MVKGDQFHHWLYVAILVFASAVTLICFAILLRWMFRERRMGGLIVNAGKPRSRVRVLVSAIYAALWLVALSTDPAHYLISFSSVFLVISCTALVITGVLEVRERGLFSDHGVVSWDRVKAWYWENPGGLPTTQWSGAVEPGPAVMKIELTRPLFFRRSVRILVPFAFVDAVSRLMDEHVAV